jgi:hypothetical protein
MYCQSVSFVLHFSDAMPTIAKTATLDALGLSTGDHVVRFHVEADVISFEIAASRSPLEGSPPAGRRKSTGFLRRWGSTALKLEGPSDPWLTHINDETSRISRAHPFQR